MTGYKKKNIIYSKTASVQPNVIQKQFCIFAERHSEFWKCAQSNPFIRVYK